MVTKDTKEEEEATCPLVRFSKQNKSLSSFKTPSKQSNVHSQANPKWVSIPQDWGKRWKDGWVVTLTKLSPRTHWLIGADPAFLQALYLGTTLRIFKMARKMVLPDSKCQNTVHQKLIRQACQHTTVWRVVKPWVEVWRTDDAVSDYVLLTRPWPCRGCSASDS